MGFGLVFRGFGVWVFVSGFRVGTHGAFQSLGVLCVGESLETQGFMF